jgi:hypothetical protein
MGAHVVGWDSALLVPRSSESVGCGYRSSATQDAAVKADNQPVGDVSPELADFLSAQEGERARARQRLMDGAVYSELLESPLRSRRRRFPRSVTVFLMSSATVSLELVALHSYFGWSGFG